MATSSKAVAARLDSQYGDSGQYFRFNVDKGLEDVTLSDWERSSAISAHTQNYLQDNQRAIKKFVDSLAATIRAEEDQGGETAQTFGRVSDRGGDGRLPRAGQIAELPATSPALAEGEQGGSSTNPSGSGIANIAQQQTIDQTTGKESTESARSHSGISDRANSTTASNQVNTTDGYDTAGWTILHAAVRRGDLQGTRLALQHGYDPNKATDDALWTPLWVAACFGNSEITRLLLDAGANADAVTRSGSTAVREAALLGSVGVLTLLIERGVDLEVCPHNTLDTPLICAAAKGHSEAAKLLLRAGANVNAQQHGGWAPLHYALQGRNEGMVREILQYSPDSNISTATGVRPLHLAAMYGLASVVGELVVHGAAIDAEDRHGLTPLRVAVQAGDLETVQTFVSKGANVAIKDDQDLSLLDVARQLGHTNVYLWLEGRMAR